MAENKTATKAKKTQEKKEQKKDVSKKEETPQFKGEYIRAVGRRKKSVAQVRLYKKGKGNIIVNGKKHEEFFDSSRAVIATQPLKLTNHLKDLDFSIIVKGGGPNGQAEAVRHGISRCLITFDEELAPSLKAKRWLTRDPRKKERKKPGLKKARRAPQWSKR